MLGIALASALLILFATAWVEFAWVRAPAFVDRWAETHLYRIVRRRRKMLFRGPFSWKSWGLQVVFQIEIDDGSDLIKAGWFRVGGFGWPSTRRFEVRWDDRWPPFVGSHSPATGAAVSMWDRQLDG